MAKAHESHSLLNTDSIDTTNPMRVAIVYTEWNEAIVNEQIKGCLQVCERLNVHITHQLAVPGSFELPFACNQLHKASQHNADAPEAIIAFGAVIRGGTPHFDYVCQAVTQGITMLNTTLPIPVIFGVLTLDSEAQAWERLGGEHGHKGQEAAITALKMIQYSRKLRN